MMQDHLTHQDSNSKKSRSARFAGSWYSGDAISLEENINSLLKKESPIIPDSDKTFIPPRSLPTLK